MVRGAASETATTGFVPRLRSISKFIAFKNKIVYSVIYRITRCVTLSCMVRFHSMYNSISRMIPFHADYRVTWSCNHSVWYYHDKNTTITWWQNEHKITWWMRDIVIIIYYRVNYMRDEYAIKSYLFTCYYHINNTIIKWPLRRISALTIIRHSHVKISRFAWFYLEILTCFYLSQIVVIFTYH
jgi:hypothetical protein